MKTICHHCQKIFEPKRNDAIYCGASCRQLAYVLRKANHQAELLPRLILVFPGDPDGQKGHPYADQPP